LGGVVVLIVQSYLHWGPLPASVCRGNRSPPQASRFDHRGSCHRACDFGVSRLRRQQRKPATTPTQRAHHVFFFPGRNPRVADLRLILRTYASRKYTVQMVTVAGADARRTQQLLGECLRIL
jgi:hypothetical protein